MNLLAAVLVFVSYARTDAPAAHRVVADLRRAGCKVWIDTEQLKPGSTWTREIERAIDGSDVLVTLVSSASYRSKNVRAEQSRAARKGKRIVPVLLDGEGDRTLIVESLQWITPGEVGTLCRTE